MTVCPILVGRDVPLRQLIESASSGGTLLVAGEAGIGKSRLLRAFASECTGLNRAVVWGRPDTLNPGPYSLIADLLFELAEGAERSEEALLLAEALESPSSARGELPTRQVAARTRGLLGALPMKPVVLLEDLHAADEASHAVVAHLARASSDDGTLIVASYRTESKSSVGLGRLLEFLARDRLASELRLEPLSPEQVAEMLSAIRGGALDEGEVRHLQSLAEGVPFYVEELASSPRPTGGVPSSILTSIENRLAGLPQQHRILLVQAALFHGRIEPDILAAAAGASDDDVGAALAAGEEVGLLAVDTSGVGFRHGLVRDAVLAFAAELDVSAARRALVGAIETLRGPGELDVYARELAALLGEAGDASGAARYWLMAGEAALVLGSLDDAEDCFVNASSGDERVRVRAALGQAEVHRRRGDVGAAEELLRNAMEVPDRSSLEAALALADLLSSARDEAALAILSLVSDKYELTEEESVRVQFLVGRASQRLGREPESAALQRALEGAQRLGDRKLEAEILATVAVNRSAAGEHDQALELGEAAARTALEDGNPQLVGATHVAQATNLGHLGRGEEAMGWLARARHHLTSGLSSYLVASVDNVSAWVLWRMGRVEDAERHAQRVALRELPHGYGRVIRVWAALERNDITGARDFLSSWWRDIGDDRRNLGVKELLELPDSSLGVAYALLADAIALAFGGDIPDAEGIARAATYAELCSYGPPDSEAFAQFLLGKAQLAAGNLPAAQDAASTAERLVEKHDLALQGALLLELKAGVAASRGEREEALRLGWAGVERLEKLGSGSDLARIELFLGVLETGKRSIELLRRAWSRGKEVGALRTSGQAAAALRERGIRPRAGRARTSAGDGSVLSTREEEVAALVATGMTNGEIAARLYISARTVQDHVANASRKAGVSGRAGLAAWAAKQGLV